MVVSRLQYPPEPTGRDFYSSEITRRDKILFADGHSRYQ